MDKTQYNLYSIGSPIIYKNNRYVITGIQITKANIMYELTPISIPFIIDSNVILYLSHEIIDNILKEKGVK